MESKNELKQTDGKNLTSYYFDDIMRHKDIYSGDILLHEKSYKTYKTILIDDISKKTFMGLIPLRIRFEKIDGFIKIYDGIRYLVILDRNWLDKICDSIKYLISEKGGITDIINHNFARIRIDSYNSLPVQKNNDFS